MKDPRNNQIALRSFTERLWEYAVAERFCGSDPYDGLKSRLLAPAIRRSRYFRLLTIQALKRSPIDLRPVLRVPKGVNPKGLALFLTGVSEYPVFEGAPEQETWLEDALLSCASLPDGSPAFGTREHKRGLAEELGAGHVAMPRAIGWGYDFPWQARAFLVPAFAPTVVATSFAIDALSRAGSRCYTAAAEAAACFVSENLHRHETEEGICFSYSSGDRSRVFNASLFGAKILAMAASAGETPQRDEWQRMARRAADYVVSHQRGDGAWSYGESGYWHWVDNVHTGFILETLERLARLLGVDQWDEALMRGMAYYREHLFEDDGTARYSDRGLYPLDPHAFAQGALTFLEMRERFPVGVEFARDILSRCIDHLSDTKRGGFRFQKHRFYSIGTRHMRWSQGWMFRALCAYLAVVERDPSVDS